MRKRSLSLLVLSTMILMAAPSGGALQSVDGSSLVSMIQTSWHWRRRARHHSFKPSMYSSQCLQLCVTKLASVAWSKRSFKANVSNGCCSGNNQRKASLVINKDSCFVWKWRSMGQFGTAQNDSSIHFGVRLRAERCGRVCPHSRARDLHEPKSKFKIPLRLRVVGIKKMLMVKVESLLSVMVALFLVTDDVVDSGSERHETLVRKIRKRFRFGKYRSYGVTKVTMTMTHTQWRWIQHVLDICPCRHERCGS